MMSNMSHLYMNERYTHTHANGYELNVLLSGTLIDETIKIHTDSDNKSLVFYMELYSYNKRVTANLW